MEFASSSGTSSAIFGNNINAVLYQKGRAMQQTIVERSEIKLIGIRARTSYSQELNPMEASIFKCVQKFFHETLFEKIPNRKNPGTTICAYSEYESEYKGAYTYFIGEEVTAVPSPLPEGLHALTIPPQRYVRYTSGPAPMPEVVVNAWKNIWSLSPKELGGKRSYLTDFELYDERAADHTAIVLDIYIGITSDTTTNKS
jgi:predicted transcriptional regulator YdeE